MRHLRSILYALVLAPAVWTLCGVGFTQDLTGRARSGQSIEQITGLLLLVLAGAAYAILLLPRLSPAGPALAGLAFLGVSVWALVAPGSFGAIWSPTVTKEGFDLTLPAYGLAALLAVPLLCTTLSARRWRRDDHVPAATGAFRWPFARPAHPGTLVVPGVTGIPAAEDTQLLSGAVRPGTDQVATDLVAGERTQVISTTVRLPPPAPAAPSAPGSRPADTTQIVSARPADETQVVGSTGAAADATPAPTAASSTAGSSTASGPAAPAPAAGTLTSVVAAEEPIDAPAAVPGSAAHAGATAAGDAAAEDRTQVVGSTEPGEKTQVISASQLSKVTGAGEKTQVITTGALSRALAAGEKTQVISVGKQADALLVGEQTQVISTADSQQAAAESELTQIVRVSDTGDKTQVVGWVGPGDQAQSLAAGGTVQAPADSTQVIRIAMPPREGTAAPQPAGAGEPAKGGPAGGDEPTTGEPVNGAAATGEAASGEAVSADTTTVLSRPDDEPTAAVDTTDDDPTAAVAGTQDDEPTAAVGAVGEPTVVVAAPDDETVVVTEAPPEERTEPQAAPASVAADDTEAVSAPVRRRTRPRQRKPSRQESTEDADRTRPL